MSRGKGKGKRTHLETFQDENKAEDMVMVNHQVERHARRMAEHDQRMAELELKKRRMDLEADGKRREAEACQLNAKYQREREKEKHDMEMLRLCLQFQLSGGGSGVSALATPAGQFGLEQQQEVFPTPNVFESMGTGIDGAYQM
jgi:septal ring factor EnvC (AmiA/AmiB activator)